MPKVERAGRRSVYLDMDAELHGAIQILADSNGRPFKDELEHALRRHLAQPPKRVIVETVPALDDATIEQAPAAPAPAKKRGRPRSKGGN